MENFFELEQEQKFEKYYNELISYNEKVNLTAITDKNEVYIKHFYDSCLGKDLIPQNSEVLDLGTGAGFPGIPLKIVRPDIKLTLVDSLQKRIIFLNYLREVLKLDYTCFHARAEEFATVQNREKFDIVVARAVASLNTLCEYCLPFVKIGGKFLAYKGSNVEGELKDSEYAISLLGAKVENVLHFSLPDNLGERTIVIIKKVNETPKTYPRGKNLPKLKPLMKK